MEYLENNGMEEDFTDNWSCVGGCTLETSADSYSGTHSAKVSNRSFVPSFWLHVAVYFTNGDLSVLNSVYTPRQKCGILQLHGGYVSNPVEELQTIKQRYNLWICAFVAGSLQGH